MVLFCRITGKINSNSDRALTGKKNTGKSTHAEVLYNRARY